MLIPSMQVTNPKNHSPTCHQVPKPVTSTSTTTPSATHTMRYYSATAKHHYEAAAANKHVQTVEISVNELSLASPPSSAPVTPLPRLQDLFYASTWSQSETSGGGLIASRANAIAAFSPVSPLALKAALEQKKAATKKIAGRSLWKCRRRPLSMQDLLCVEVTRPNNRERSEKASHRRQCGVTECFKYALSGGFCISHGGGKPCRQEDCHTVAQSGGLCKAHGGGSKCKTSGCSSVARRKGFCMLHGGRQSCKIDGCDKCAHGGGLCIAHGGGKRCSTKDCTKSAQAGGFCYSHGGGKRCTAPQCFQAARKGGRCIRHREDTDSAWE